MPSKRLLAVMDDEERRESMKERRAEKKTPSLEQKEKAKGKGILRALGERKATGNFKKIEKSKGKGAAVAALQNKLAKRRGEPAPYHK